MSPPPAPYVIVCGASSGIGEAIAREYARRGAHIALFARRQDRLEELAGRARSLGAASTLVLPGDVSVPGEVVCAAQILDRAWPRLDRAYLNAGTGGDQEVACCAAPGARIGTFAAREWDDTMRTNYSGALHWLEAILPRMREQRAGHIAVTGSMAADRAMPQSGPYAASKAALRALVESLRVDAGRFGVRMTLIEPGYVKSELTSRMDRWLPFITSTDDAAVRFVRGVEAGEALIRYPWQMSLLSRLGAQVPRPIFDLWAKWNLRGR